MMALLCDDACDGAWLHYWCSGGVVYVYVTLDGRTRGKAAIDVVGSQVGAASWSSELNIT
jgi:hypothetical protein